MEKNKFYLNFIFAVFLSILIGSGIYSFTIPLILNMNINDSLVFIQKKIFTILPLSFLATFILSIFYRPINKCLNKSLANEKAGENEIKKARYSLYILPKILFLIGFGSYFVGVSISLAIDYLKHVDIDTVFALSYYIAGVLWGFLNGIITERIVNIVLIKSKIHLKIYSIENEKTTSTFKKLFFPIFILILWFFVFVFLTAYYTNFQNTNDTLSSFFTGSINGFSNLTYMFSVLSFLFLLLTSLITIILHEFQSYVKNLKNQITLLTENKMDLTKRMWISNYDDIGFITHGINRMINNLNKTFLSISDTSNAVFQSSNIMNSSVKSSLDIINSADNLIKKMENQTENQTQVITNVTENLKNLIKLLENSSFHVENQVNSVHTNSENILGIIDYIHTIENSLESQSSVFNNLSSSVGQGSEIINSMISDMDHINTSNEQIKNLISLISDLADKTNLLAMNASIEAAHAGQYGKGFSVVASEIRKLSETTSASAKEIEMQINGMNSNIQQGLNHFNQQKSIFSKIIDNVKNAVKIISQIRDSLSDLNQRAQLSKQDMNTLFTATEKLKTNITDQKQHNYTINNSLHSINDMSEDAKNLNQEMIKFLNDFNASFQVINKECTTTFSSINSLKELIVNFQT